MTTFTQDEAVALLVLALGAAEKAEPPLRRMHLGAVIKLGGQIIEAAERAIAELSQPSLLPVARPKRGRPPGARTRKPRQTELPQAAPDTEEEDMGGAS